MNIDFINKLKERDLLYQQTNSTNMITGIYCGFDLTADSLHIGNLTPLAILRIASLFNIPVITILGEATSMIGDPSGKTETRKKISNELIKYNLKKIKKQIKHFIPNSKILNNLQWIKKLNTIDFLNLSSYLPVSYIIKLKTFAKRLEENAPFNMQELLYPLIQGYDFLYLFENYNCNAQIGGQDQWCNMITGSELIKSKHNKESSGITLPLLTKANGEKMGKTVNGAIWLSKEKISVYDFWQFWRNVEDSMVLTYIKRFTLVDLNNLPNNVNEQKILLANEVTTWVFNAKESRKAYEKSNEIFNKKNHQEAVEIETNSNIISEILIQILKNSKSENKRLIEQKAIKVNNEIITDHKLKINNNDVIQIGKIKFYKVKIN